MQLREEIMSINQQALIEKRDDIYKRIRDFEDLKNQSESDENMIPVLADIKRQIDEDLEALHEYTDIINDEARASRAEIGKLLRNRAARKPEESSDEDNSE